MEIREILEAFRQYIKDKGLRYTKQREAILKAFLRADGHVTVEELYMQLRKKHPGIGFSTVYRTIKLIEDAGLATRLSFDERAERFEKTVGTDHHDHMVCIRCRRVIEFESPRIERLQTEVADKYRFQILSHRLEIFGLCNICRPHKSLV